MHTVADRPTPPDTRAVPSPQYSVLNSAILGRRPPRWLVLVSCLLLVSGCAGYQLGNAGLYPAHISTVYVPVFESVSFRRNLGEQLTEAVMKEIERRTPYKVVGTPDADSILSGRIIGENKHIVVQSHSGDPRQVEVALRVKVQWIDRSGAVIRDGAPISLDDASVDVSGASKFIPEVGQSGAVARQTAIQRVAGQIVSLMESPW